MEDANSGENAGALAVDQDEIDNDAVAPFEDESNQPEQFNIDLASEHNYLGNLERVAGVQYLEPNRNYTIPVILHSSLVFPGETVPMILPQHMFLAAMANEPVSEEGLLFGLIFRELQSNQIPNILYYGVTCQIYERSNDDVPEGNVSIKSRAYQRFIIKTNEPIIEYGLRFRVQSATVNILPEIVLAHPIYGSYDSNSSSRFRSSEKSELKLQNYQSKSLYWPHFVYKMYDVVAASKKIQEFLLTLKIETVPMDLISLSFWFSKNAILSRERRRKLFLTNNVLERIILICKSLKDEKVIVCKGCGATIAKFDSLFPMSKEGIRSNYCNSGGFIHDTHTITNTLPDVVSYEGRLTDEFSWFPGYTYRYVHCANCNNQLGWKYFSRNLIPRSFIGLSAMFINFANSTTSDLTDRWIDLTDGSEE